MVRGMMTTTSKSVGKRLIVLFLFINVSLSFFYAEDKKWVIAAQKFTYTKGQVEDSVTKATAETIPISILEKLNKTLERNIYPDEKLSRTKYQSRTERQSLFMQLTSEYKKRDSLVLYNYSESKMKSALNEENKKIQEIKERIDENLKKLREAEEETEENMKLVSSETKDDNFLKEKTEIEKLKTFFKRIFVKNESIIGSENVQLYRNDATVLFTPSEEAIKSGYLSYKFEKEAYSAGINTLITGQITNYDDYISVSVDVYLYPGFKKIGTVMEISSMEDMDLLAANIANQIIPMLTNSMPVEVYVKIGPEEAFSHYELYIDDVLQENDSYKIIMESGVHTLQCASEGYKTAETSFYFEGNRKYNIEINLVENKEGYIQIGLKKPIIGDVFVNGQLATPVSETKTQIKINGNEILGEFIAENGQTAFFYIPPQLYFDKSFVTINPKPMDREKYIDTRRKWMYGSYSLLMVSLIPFFYTYGNLINNAKLYDNQKISYEEAYKWQKAYNICSYISIGCGIFWGIELIRYFIAANSVLPQKAKAGDLSEYLYVDNTIENTEVNIEENKEINIEEENIEEIKQNTEESEQ